MARLTRRGLIAGGVPLLGGALLHSQVPHSHPWDHEALAAEPHAGHGAVSGILVGMATMFATGLLVSV